MLPDNILFKIAVRTRSTYEATFNRMSGDAMPCDFEDEINKQTKAKYFENQNISKDIIQFSMLLKNYNDFSATDSLEILSEYSLLSDSEIKKAVELKNIISEWTYNIFVK